MLTKLCTAGILSKSSGNGTPVWGISSAGRALAWHARGHRFDPGILHQTKHAAENILQRAFYFVCKGLLLPLHWARICGFIPGTLVVLDFLSMFYLFYAKNGIEFDPTPTFIIEPIYYRANI